ncbi:MAG: CRISPR-associated endoribonuclease Cas6 [Syntrophomonadales bacterium]|jgi:CRISPR-associated endoribonuclease Cas6
MNLFGNCIPYRYNFINATSIYQPMGLFAKLKNGGESMRLQLVFNREEGENSLTISLDYRNSIISVIKYLLDGSWIGQRYSKEHPGYPPYACALTFGKILSFQRETRTMTVRLPIMLTISTGDFQIFTALCNGAIGQQNSLSFRGVPLYGIHILNERPIHSEQVCFSTVSHMLLPTPAGYIGSNQAAPLEEAINYHMFKRVTFYRELWNIRIPDLSPISVLDASDLNKGVSLHYGGYLTTLRGHLVLKGSPESLKLLYDFGIGSKCGQGYGLMKVVD